MKVLVLQHLEKTNCFPRCALYLGDVISGQNNKRRKKERKKVVMPCTSVSALEQVEKIDSTKSNHGVIASLFTLI